MLGQGEDSEQMIGPGEADGASWPGPIDRIESFEFLSQVLRR